VSTAPVLRPVMAGSSVPELVKGPLVNGVEAFTADAAASVIMVASGVPGAQAVGEAQDSTLHDPDPMAQGSPDSLFGKGSAPSKQGSLDSNTPDLLDPQGPGEPPQDGAGGLKAA